MRTTKFICILFMFLLLVISITGCGGGDGSTSTASVADSPASGNGSGGAVTGTGQANLAWDASTATNVAGYKLYYGTSSRNYSNNINVGPVTSYTVSGRAPGTYYLTVTAYDASGNESGFSNEAIKTIQ
jgi:hypothetical protein